MCSPAFLYPMARVSEETASMPIPDNAKGFPVVEDAFMKQARLRLMIGLMNQSTGNQQNPFRPEFNNFRKNSNAIRDTLEGGQGPGFGFGSGEQGQDQGP